MKKEKYIILRGTLGYDNISIKQGSCNSKSLIDGDMVIFGQNCVSNTQATEIEEINNLLDRGVNIFFFLYNNNINGSSGSFFYKIFNSNSLKIATRYELNNVSDNNIFTEYYNRFKNYLYSDFVISRSWKKTNQTLLYEDKSQDIAGWFETERKGHLIYLPAISFKAMWSDFQSNQKELTSECNNLIENLSKIDDFLKSKNNPVIIKPKWLEKKEYSFNVELEKKELIENNNNKIISINNENNSLLRDIQDIEEYKVLLYGKGTPLELSVTKALSLLGFKVEANVQCGNHEIDHVFNDEDGKVYLGETGGKNKILDQEKLGQLVLKHSAFCEHKNKNINSVTSVLFANAFCLDEPSKVQASGSFSEHAIDLAKNNHCILFSTKELFKIVKYVLNNRQNADLANIRKAINNSKGKIFTFNMLDHDNIKKSA